MVNYFLSRDIFRKEGVERMTGAVGHKRVSKEFIEDCQIPIPLLSEQQRIVDILDKAFESITVAKANTEKNLKNTRELVETYLQTIIVSYGDNWITKKLGDITTKIGSGSTPLGGQTSYKKIGISLIRSMNVYDRYFKETA